MYMLSFNLIGEALSELPEVNGLNFPIAGFSRSVEASSQADFYWTSLETPGVNALNWFSNESCYAHETRIALLGNRKYINSLYVI